MEQKAQITVISKNYCLITLPPPLSGFDNFISVWVHTGNPCFIIDVGPASTANALINALKELKIKNLDYILLTHIHLDHAGACGHIAKQFPNTPIVCHPKAIDHLAAPQRLWEGSLKTLGNIAVAYGEIIPTQKDQLMDTTQFDEPAVTAVMTPGHAPHHLSFFTRDYLFAGEACGVHIKLDANTLYQRPATPPKFFMETTLHSVDLLIRQNPKSICFGHFGIESNAVYWLGSHKKQLTLWKDVISEEMKNEGKKSFYPDCIKALIKEDPFFAPYASLDPATQSRETDLVNNSIKGIMGYLKSAADNT